MLPLEKSLIYKGFELAEVTLQQALQSLAVAGLVAGHLMSVLIYKTRLSRLYQWLQGF